MSMRVAVLLFGGGCCTRQGTYLDTRGCPPVVDISWRTCGRGDKNVQERGMKGVSQERPLEGRAVDKLTGLCLLSITILITEPVLSYWGDTLTLLSTMRSGKAEPSF